MRWQDNYSSFGLISTARLNPSFFGDRSDPELATSRLQKLATKTVGFLYYRLPPSSDPESPLSEQMNSLESIDSRHQSF
jgi:predicted Zn-dependent protease